MAPNLPALPLSRSPTLLSVCAEQFDDLLDDTRRHITDRQIGCPENGFDHPIGILLNPSCTIHDLSTRRGPLNYFGICNDFKYGEGVTACRICVSAGR